MGVAGTTKSRLPALPQEALFHLCSKKHPDRAAQLLLDHLVGIKERELQPPGQLAPDGGFTGSGEADQCDTRHLPLKLVRRCTVVDTIRWRQERAIDIIANNEAGDVALDRRAF